MLKKILKVIGVIVLGIAIYLAVTILERQPVIGGAVNLPIIYSGATNATTSIGSGPTVVFSGTAFSTYARISNPNPSTISCYLENATAASSTLVAGGGVIIGAASTTFTGENSVCFGTGSGCIPYVGQVNCRMVVTSTVGIIYK